MRCLGQIGQTKLNGPSLPCVGIRSSSKTCADVVKRAYGISKEYTRLTTLSVRASNGSDNGAQTIQPPWVVPDSRYTVHENLNIFVGPCDSSNS